MDGDFLGHVWQMLVGRADGPMAVRFILQPTVAVVLATVTALRDAREDRAPFFFWAIVTDPARRPEIFARIRKSVGKVFVAAIVIDVIYELLVYRWIYPGQAIIVATLLAIVPFLLICGPITRLVNHFRSRSKSPPAAPETGVDPRVDLAVVRTELALDRTQLAWVRTAFSLITGGFAIDKVAGALHAARVLSGTNWVTGSHVVGISLTATATVFLLLESAAYYRQLDSLARLKVNRTRKLPLALLVSLLVVLLGGTLLFFALLWR